MDFIPEQKEAQQVPYFEDTTSEAGWAGHTTGKSRESLENEVRQSVERLGGMVIGFQRGKFSTGDRERPGFVMHYILTEGEQAIKGRMDIAGLPVKPGRTYRSRQGKTKRLEQSYKMALFMLRDALNGMWYLQQLAPGFAPLMPWLQVDASGKTITQLWSERANIGMLLPSGDDQFEGDEEEVIIDAEYTE